MFVASDEATAGSVIANAERISPASSGCNQRSCCSVVPNMVRISMLPVSGAEQLQASDAEGGRSHDLGQRRVVEVRESFVPFGGVGQEEVPQSPAVRLGLEVLDDRGMEVRIARGAHLFEVDVFGGSNPLVHEGGELLGQFGTAR